MGPVSNVLPAQRGLYVVIGAKLSRFQSRLRVYNIYGYIYSAGYDVNSCTINKFQQRQYCARVMHFSAFHCYM